MTEKTKTHEGKHRRDDSHEKKQEEVKNYMTTQNILAVLLVLSLLANAYFLIKLNEKSAATTTQNTTTTTIQLGGRAAKIGDLVKVDYVGKLANGTIFDTSIEEEAIKAGIQNPLRKYEPFTLVLGKGLALKAFEDGLVGMKVGEEKTIRIPAGQGYATGYLADKELVFDVKMIEISTPKKVSMIVLNDKRCSECQMMAKMVVEQLQQVFADLSYVEYDYSSEEGKKLYRESKIKYLPAILFDSSVKDSDGYMSVQNYLEVAGQYLSLRIGADFDPASEGDCENKVDDNGDGLVDCEDPTCKTNAACAKTAKPVVEAFVMSHCPYGTQIEKGLIPVVKALGDTIDFNIKFVYYAMHGKKEVDEQLAQYCIQKTDKNKYLDYLTCFLNSTGGTTADQEECLKKTGFDKKTIDACIKEADAKYNISADYNDKSKWISGSFPPFNIHREENEKYDVAGSPTLVVNGVTLEGVNRSPQGLLTAICRFFTEKPAACSQNLSATTPSAGFGYSEAAGTSSGGCGA